MILIPAIVGGLTVGAAVAAMALRDLVRASLCLVASFAGLGVLYLGLGAEFAAFAQLLVYVGAVAILILFTVILTRGGEPDGEPHLAHPIAALVAAVAVFAVLASAIVGAKSLDAGRTDAPEVSVKDIGDKLSGGYALPLETLALLLTAALIGAAVVALREPASKPAEDGDAPEA
jgi:NADH-quinone oxidoreductase subunit J